MDVDRRFCLHPDGAVIALARQDSTLYVGGYFSRLGGKRRSVLAALDATTGSCSAFGSRLQWTAQLSRSLFAAGRSTSSADSDGSAKDTTWPCGRGRRHRPRHSWDPPQPPSVGSHGDSSVRAIAASQSTRSMSAVCSIRLEGGAVKASQHSSPATGRITNWDPRGLPCCVSALAVAGDRLYVGGGALDAHGPPREPWLLSTEARPVPAWKSPERRRSGRGAGRLRVNGLRDWCPRQRQVGIAETLSGSMPRLGSRVRSLSRRSNGRVEALGSLPIGGRRGREFSGIGAAYARGSRRSRRANRSPDRMEPRSESRGDPWLRSKRSPFRAEDRLRRR